LEIQQFAIRKALDVVYQWSRGGAGLSIFAENFVKELVDFVPRESHKENGVRVDSPTPS